MTCQVVAGSHVGHLNLVTRHCVGEFTFFAGFGHRQGMSSQIHFSEVKNIGDDWKPQKLGAYISWQSPSLDRLDLVHIIVADSKVDCCRMFLVELDSQKLCCPAAN